MEITKVLSLPLSAQGGFRLDLVQAKAEAFVWCIVDLAGLVRKLVKFILLNCQWLQKFATSKALKRADSIYPSFITILLSSLKFKFA